MGIETLWYKIFGVKSGIEYLIDPEDIKVPGYYFKTKIGHEKYERKKRYYIDTGEFESIVKIRRKDWELVDGYSTYVLAKMFGQKVPAVFVD